VQDAFLKAYSNLNSSGTVEVLHVAGAHCRERALMKLRRRRPSAMVSLDGCQDRGGFRFRARSRLESESGATLQAGELKDILTRTIQGLPPSFGLYLS